MYFLYIFIAWFTLVKIRNYLNVIEKIIMCLLDSIYSIVKIMNMMTVYPLVKNCKDKTKLVRYVCYDYSYLMRSTNIQIKKMERPGRNLIAVTVVTLGVWFLSFFYKLLPFIYLFIVTVFTFLKLEDNCFTTLCWFLPINMNEPQVYRCPLPPTSHHILPRYLFFV